MTPDREFNAATVEEAIEIAAADLGTSAEEISYTVADAGSSGFMGIGARDARILVSVDVSTVDDTEETQPGVSELEPPDQEPEVSESHDSDGGTPDAVPDDLLQESREYMQAIVEGLDLEDTRLDVYDAGEFVAVDVATEEAGLFIGQKGETIDALQYLLNVAVYRDRPFSKRIILDSEGYRQRRIEALQGMAHRSARRAVRERRTVELPPMNPAERRVVHIFLKDNPRVTTASEGTGDNRRVCISPV